MNPNPVRFDLLFDADEYFRFGFCPWTFFAYPTGIADARGLPPDKEACSLLGHLQERGIKVAVWVNGVAEGTTYFACRKEDVQMLQRTIQDLEDTGVIEKGFCSNRSEQLFAAFNEHNAKR